MQLKKTKLVQKIGLAIFGVSFAYSASADTFTAAVTTIDDVEITEKTALDFGSIVLTTPGECTMNSDAPGTTIMEYTTTSDSATAAANYGATTGESCVNVAGSDTTVSPGVWRVRGTAGAGVDLLISSLAQGSADYTFTPSGCYADFDGTTGPDGDKCTTLSVGTPTDGALLAAVTSSESDTGNLGTPATPGDLLFTVGGKITIINPLAAETSYPLTFQVDVVYN